MKKLLVFILLGITIVLTAQTNVSGVVSGTWTSVGNPYNVTGNLSVSNGTTLNINEGVEIYFQGLYSFTINGTLNAIGTSTNKILFTVGGSATVFGSITFSSTASGSITHAIVEHGDKQGSNPHGGGILISGCDPTISYTEVRECHATWGGGIFAFDDASPIIEWNNIHDNTADNLGGGIAMNGSGTNMVTIRFNEIYDNTSQSSSYGGGGISFYTGTTANIYDNVIYNNTSTSTTHSGGVFSNGSTNTINMWNNIVWGNTNNGTDPQINGSSTATVTYCDVQGGYTGTGNINSDPLFASTTPGSEDFHITPGSPCINVGNPASDVPEGGGSRIDIGVYEFIATVPVIENGIDTSFSGNEVEGAACSFAAETGTVDISAQEFFGEPPNSGGKDVIQRYWELEATGSAFVRLYFNNNDIVTISSPKIFQYISGSWTELASSVVGTEGTSRYLDSTNPISNWGTRATSQFTVGEEDAPLPITLSSFTAVLIEDLPTLYWVTESELNNTGWNIYRTEINDFSNAVHINQNLISGAGTTIIPTHYEYVDDYLIVGGSTYWYWLEDVSNEGETEIHPPTSLTIPLGNTPQIPEAYKLQQNYPNPFNPSTTISFELINENYEATKLVIYNLHGQKVKTLLYDMLNTGIHQATWNGKDEQGNSVSSGLYFYTLKSGNFSETKKMILMK